MNRKFKQGTEKRRRAGENTRAYRVGEILPEGGEGPKLLTNEVSSKILGKDETVQRPG